MNMQTERALSVTDDRTEEVGFAISPVSLATVIVAVLLGIYWMSLFYGTHSPLPVGILPGHTDKLIHFLAFAGLGALLISVRATRGIYPWKSVFRRWFVLMVYGALDEMTQPLVNRTADFKDWLADVIGAALGLAVVTFVLWCYHKPLQRQNAANSVAESAG